MDNQRREVIDKIILASKVAEEINNRIGEAGNKQKESSGYVKTWYEASTGCRPVVDIPTYQELAGIHTWNSGEAVAPKDLSPRAKQMGEERAKRFNF
ncbi:MAG: hypothetical protein IJ837_00315 [Clostridia bacterium]|nr:hypothetical protein [Clostridia bacterium]